MIGGEELVALCVFDLNNLRIINNDMGHDRAMNIFACLRNCFRGSSSKDFTGRDGGDEFLVVLKGNGS